MNTIEGTVSRITDVETGLNKLGKEWRKQGFAIRTNEQYEKTIYFQAFNKVTEYIDNLNVGDDVEVAFYAESREYNEKYYTSLNAVTIKVTRANANAIKALPTETATLPKKEALLKPTPEANATYGEMAKFYPLKKKESPSIETLAMQDLVKRGLIPASPDEIEDLPF